MSSRRAKKINGQFVAHRIEMRVSAAWRALRGSDKLVLERLELEHAHHGGCENGRLVVTYDNFEEHGLRRKSVAECLARVEALGFAVCEKRGRASYAQSRTPSLYRLTYLPGNAIPTDDWKAVADDCDAQGRIDRALEELKVRSKPLRKRLARKLSTGEERADRREAVA